MLFVICVSVKVVLFRMCPNNKISFNLSEGMPVFCIGKRLFKQGFVQKNGLNDPLIALDCSLVLVVFRCGSWPRYCSIIFALNDRLYFLVSLLFQPMGK